jgi:hypothetical protein
LRATPLVMKLSKRYVSISEFRINLWDLFGAGTRIGVRRQPDMLEIGALSSGSIRLGQTRSFNDAGFTSGFLPKADTPLGTVLMSS